MKRTLLLSVAALSLAATPLACGSYSSGSHGSGGNTAVGSSSTGSSTGGSTTSNSSTGGSSAGGSSANGSSANAGSSSDSSSSSGGSSMGVSSSTGGTGSSTGVSSSSGGATGGSKGGTTSDSAGAKGGTTGGTAGASGGSASSTAVSTSATLPSDIFTKAGNTVVSAHSTVRVIVSGYTGPLYELCKGTANPGPDSCKGTKQNVGSKAGYADVETHKTFCPSGSTCTITKIFDQSGKGNDLEPAPKGGVCGADMPANANDLPVTINGHSAFGIKIVSNKMGPGVGHGYRTGCTGCTIKKGNGVPLGDDPESMYMITSQKDLYNGCCFDYGNAETTSTDNKNGTMETLYFGGGVWWGTGSSGARETDGQWVMADLEDGLYAGWNSDTKSDQRIATNTPNKYDFVTAVLLGDTADKNGGKGRFVLFGGNATTGTVKTMYDGIRPEKPGYAPAKKEGSIILGIGGDNSCSAGGDFLEGMIGAGQVLSKDAVDSLQTVIVAAKYETIGK